jgi:hypothetical protein
VRGKVDTFSQLQFCSLSGSVGSTACTDAGVSVAMIAVRATTTPSAVSTSTACFVAAYLADRGAMVDLHGATQRGR